MKIIHKNLERNQNGSIKLIAEDSEDIWTVYNLIHPGDQVESVTYRRVQTETASGKMDSDRLKMTLCLEVERIDIDLTTGVLSLKGKNKTENKFVKIGAYHTTSVEVGQPFRLYKEYWDSVSLERIQHSCNIQEKAEIAAILIQEGLCNICLVTDYSTTLVQSISVNVPKKRRGISGVNYDKVVDKFFVSCQEAVRKWVDLDRVKVVIIAGPGFANERLYQAIQSNWEGAFTRNKGKFVITHCSSALKQALDEVLRNTDVVPKISSTRFAANAKILDSFMTLLTNDPSRAYFGYLHVQGALEMGAISDLLISDSLFRSVDLGERLKYIRLVEEVRNGAGKVHIFSSAHSTGEQLDNLCGVAAILRFGIPELEEIGFEHENE